MNGKLIISLAILLLSMVSCEDEINIEDQRPDPKLVLNSIITTGEPIEAFLSTTWFYTYNNTGRMLFEIGAVPNTTVEDADVKLYVNDRLEEQMAFTQDSATFGDSFTYYADSTGLYKAKYKPAAGDHIKITAEAKGFNPISAETYISQPATIKSYTATPGEYYDNDLNRSKKGFFLNLTIKDNPNQKDFYLLMYETGAPTNAYSYYYPGTQGDYAWGRTDVYFTMEPLLSGKSNMLDKVLDDDELRSFYGFPFNDDLIDGKEYTIKVFTTEHSQSDTVTYISKATLYAIPEDYYRYMRAIIENIDGTISSDIASAGLSEPKKIFSNIEGGTGILGACTPDTITIPLPKQPDD